MCYLVRQHPERSRFDATTLARPRADRLHARWAGALALTLAGGFALAAMVAPAPAAKAPEAQPGSTAPVMQQASGMERNALPMDDGVATAPTKEVLGAGRAPCEHGF